MQGGLVYCGVFWSRSHIYELLTMWFFIRRFPQTGGAVFFKRKPFFFPTFLHQDEVLFLIDVVLMTLPCTWIHGHPKCLVCCLTLAELTSFWFASLMLTQCFRFRDGEAYRLNKQTQTHATYECWVSGASFLHASAQTFRRCDGVMCFQELILFNVMLVHVNATYTCMH